MSALYGGRYSRLLRWDDEQDVWIATIQEWPDIGHGQGWDPHDALAALEAQRVRWLETHLHEEVPAPQTVQVEARVAAEEATAEDEADALRLLRARVYAAGRDAMEHHVAIDEAARVIGECATAVLRWALALPVLSQPPPSVEVSS